MKYTNMPQEKYVIYTLVDELIVHMDAVNPNVIDQSSESLPGGRIREIGAAAINMAFSAFQVLTLPAAEEAAHQQRKDTPGHIFSI